MLKLSDKDEEEEVIVFVEVSMLSGLLHVKRTAGADMTEGILILRKGGTFALYSPVWQTIFVLQERGSAPNRRRMWTTLHWPLIPCQH